MWSMIFFSKREADSSHAGHFIFFFICFTCNINDPNGPIIFECPLAKHLLFGLLDQVLPARQPKVCLLIFEPPKNSNLDPLKIFIRELRQRKKTTAATGGQGWAGTTPSRPDGMHSRPKRPRMRRARGPSASMRPINGTGSPARCELRAQIAREHPRPLPNGRVARACNEARRAS